MSAGTDISEIDSNLAHDSAAHGGCPTVPCSPVVALRMAVGREHNYWRDTATSPFRERVYRQFARLEYQTTDGKWHPVPEVWVGQFDGDYLPENSQDQAHEAGSGCPAFPVAADVNPDGNQSGMQLRDYFAARAMQSMLLDEGYANKDWPSNITEDAYKVADAMMKSRQKAKIKRAKRPPSHKPVNPAP